jgi:hypothetical protein
LSGAKVTRVFRELAIRLVIAMVILALGLLVALFIRVTSYVPQTVNAEEIRTLCDAEKQEGRYWRIENAMSDCAERGALMEKQAAQFQGFSLRHRDYVYFTYRAATDGKAYRGVLPVYGLAPEIGSKLEIRVSRINHNHYTY